MEKEGISYQDRFEDVLYEEGLEGKMCKIFLIGGLITIGRVEAVERYCIRLKGKAGENVIVRPESIIVVIKEIETSVGEI